MAYSESLVANNFQMQTISDALNTAFTAAGLPLESRFIPASETSYTSGNGGFEIYDTSEEPALKIAGLVHSSSYGYTPSVNGAEWSYSQPFTGVAAAASGPVIVFVCGKCVYLSIGYNTTNQRYSGGMIFALDTNNQVCVGYIPISLTSSSSSQFPSQLRTWHRIANPRDVQGQYAANETVAPPLGVGAAPYYKGNFMCNMPVFSQTQEPNYLQNVYCCTVCQYYDKPTYADAGGEKYLFMGYFAIKDTE